MGKVKDNMNVFAIVRVVALSLIIVLLLATHSVTKCIRFVVCLYI